MNTKLTLTIEKEVIEVAKQYAKQKGQSLSDLVENYFKLLTHQQLNKTVVTKPSRLQSLKGIIQVEEDFDYKRVLEEELVKKNNA